jgi:hypothetical protein
MTIMEAISRIDEIKPNSFSQNEKVYWLSTLDGMIKRDVIGTHEGGEDVVFNGYNEDTPISTELIVSAPYDILYIRWLESQIDYATSEYERYNSTATAFNDAYSIYVSYYNRTHMPISKGKSFKF